MNLQELKAKYANKENATAAVQTTATKIDNAVKKTGSKTKEAANKTTSAIAGAMPVTTRKHNAFASDMNKQLNGLNRRVDRHDLLLDVLAEATGTVLPSNEVMDQYLDEQAALAQQVEEVKAPVAQEEVVASVVSKVLASLGLTGTPTVLSPETDAFVVEEMAKAAEAEVEESDKDKARANALAKKEERRLAALAKKKEKAAQEREAAAQEQPQEEAPVEEQQEEEEAPAPSRKGKGRRRMGRQAPLSAE